MANESPLRHWGWGVSGFDARNSTLSGTTRSGPSGSGQFLFVTMSTATDLTVNLSTGGSLANLPIGVLQNKPSTGIAADVGIDGISKLVSGSTAIAPGMDLMASTAAAAIAATTGNYAAAQALTAATAVGQIFDALIYGTPKYKP